MSHVPDDRSFERSSEPLRDADAAAWRRVYLTAGQLRRFVLYRPRVERIETVDRGNLPTLREQPIGERAADEARSAGDNDATSS